MANQFSRLRFGLSDPKRTEFALAKIKRLTADRARSLIVCHKEDRHLGEELTNIVITPTAAVGTITFTKGSVNYSFDKVDIRFIQRVRSRKWKIHMLDTAEGIV